MINKRWILVLATLSLGLVLLVATASVFAESEQDRSQAVNQMHSEGPMKLWIDRTVEAAESNKSRSTKKWEYMRSRCIDKVRFGQTTEFKKTFKIQASKTQDSRKNPMVSPQITKDNFLSRGPINMQIIQKKLDGMVEKGCLTEKEATHKLEFIESWLGAHGDFGDRVHRKRHESKQSERIIN